MKVFISAHPIDVVFQKSLKIYDTSRVDTKRVGTVLTRLARRGHTEVNIQVDNKADTMKIHCAFPKEDNDL